VPVHLHVSPLKTSQSPQNSVLAVQARTSSSLYQSDTNPISHEVQVMLDITLRCVIPVVCVTNEREEKVVEQHN